MIKWYYFYTPDYIFYHQHLSSTLKESFDIQALLIDKLVLSSEKHHFFGITTKLDLVCRAIEDNICMTKDASNTYIVFSDATLYVNKNKVDELNQYMQHKISDGYDIMFVDFPQDNRNIGLLLIRCNMDTLQMFKDATDLITNKKIEWDQAAINHLMDTKYSTLLKSGKFEREKIICGNRLYFKESYLVFKITIEITFDKLKDFNQRFQIMLDNHLITHEEYVKNIRNI